MKIKTKKSKLKTIGIELPFGWCLVKGSKLRELQSELREEKFKAGVRLKRLVNIYRDKLIRK